MKSIAPAVTIAFTDLVEAAHGAAFDAKFPAKGTFQKQTRGGRDYWYHVMRDADENKSRVRSTYAGLVGDPQTDALVARHGSEHARHRVSKQNASLIRRAGLPSPDPMEGRIVQELSRAGLFQVGAVLVGSVAYQSYGGFLGVRLERDLHRTQDVDIAQDREIALHVGSTGEQLADIQEILKKADPTFTPVFNQTHPNSGPTRYVNSSDYKVDLLTEHKNSDRNRQAPIESQILPGAALQPLDFMDFLIKNSVRSVLLFEAGVAVVVPDPARFAIHKAVIAPLRSLAGEAGKDAKDRAQAAELLRALAYAGKGNDIAEAWSELWGGKAKVRRALANGTLGLADDAIAIIAEACIRYGDPPFKAEEDPLVALRAGR